ncbi:hypothetical protein O0L34_g2907 [Tuta absoluta]|nr:hypothetical protein O0L34_g2907 [Tuta absoluta]
MHYFLLSLLVVFALASDSNAAQIQVHGNVDVGNQFEVFFKEIARNFIMQPPSPESVITEREKTHHHKEHHHKEHHHKKHSKNKKKSKKHKKKNRRQSAVIEESEHKANKIRIYGIDDQKKVRD